MPSNDLSSRPDKPAAGAILHPERDRESLAVYGALSRTVGLGYRNKIMLVAFIGTHVPLLTLVAWLLAQSGLVWNNKLSVILVALAATLVGTGLTLLMLHHLLQPIVSTSRSLRDYLTHNRLPALPTQFADEVGVLMNDVNHTLHKLDTTIRELTYYNHETGLPNRTYFLAAIARRIEHGSTTSGASPSTGFAICLVELVNFRQLVSSLGLDRTTARLRRAGQELAGSLEHQGQLSCISDRTLGFMLETDDPDQVASSLARILAKLDTVAEPGEAQTLLSAAAASYPIDGDQVSDLFDNAQLALSEAVANPGSHAQYSHESRSSIDERARLEHELGQAIKLGQLRLFYQPVIDSVQGHTIGAEALLRWMHPDRGLQMPDEFIPLAERSDLIHAIGRWTLTEVSRQIRHWHDHRLSPGRISVNLSARQFSDPDLLPYVQEVLDAYGIHGSDLELEVTETSAMADLNHSRAVLLAVQALGVSVAIDDFGTGYSSMSYLQNLPFDQLKIDRQFVHQLTICRALITLAEGLGMSVLAEGVEIAADVVALEGLGCTRFQGFHFSHAVEPLEFEKLLGRRWGRTSQAVTLTSA